MRRRVLFLNRSFSPDVEATGQLLEELVSDLVSEFDVTVVCGPSLHVPTPSRFPWRRSGGDGVDVLRTWGTTFSKRSWVGRLANLGSYYLLAAVASLRLRPDVVVAETDPPLLGLLGAFLRRLRGVPFLYYCQDLYPDVAAAAGKLRDRRVLAFLEAANRRAYAAADRIVVLGEDMRERLRAKGVSREKIVVLPNWVDCRRIRPVSRSRFREKLRGRFVVMYSGNLGFTQDLEAVLEAATFLRDEGDIEFVFVGDGAARQELERYASGLGLANVAFFPYVPKADLADSLSAADLHLVPLRSGIRGSMVPSKVYAILAVGRPFLAAMEEDAEVARLARAHGVGLVVPPGDARALADAIRRLARRPAEARAMGSRGRVLALACFDRPVLTSRFRELLRQMVSTARDADGRNLAAGRAASHGVDVEAVGEVAHPW